MQKAKTQLKLSVRQTKKSKSIELHLLPTTIPLTKNERRKIPQKQIHKKADI